MRLVQRLPRQAAVRSFDKLFAAAPDIPILILGGNVNETLAKQAVGRGAQDYLLSDHLDSYSLPRALRNAIERKAVEDALYAEKERAMVSLNSIGDAVLPPTFLVHPAGTNQTCLCGATAQKLLSDRVHVSMECGLVAPRDLVSAQVILQRARTSPFKPQRR
jgi:hypothetical protein